MIRQIDAHYIAAEIRLWRQAHKGAILVVEGDDDGKVFERFAHDACGIQIGFGKLNVVGALDLLEDEGIPGVVAVVDADFDRLLEVDHALEGLHLTDLHDLDLTIFFSDALRVYLREYADDKLYKRTFGHSLDAVRAAIMKACVPIGYCRLVSEKRGYRLDFKDLRYDQFVRPDLTFDWKAFTSEIAGRPGAKCDAAQLEKQAVELGLKRYDETQLVNGHDVAAVLGVALRSLLGCRRVQQTWGSEVEAGLRLAFDHAAMSTTKLYAEIVNWQSARPEYVALRT